MDPLTQLCQKINAARAYQPTCHHPPTPPSTAPPPYTPSNAENEFDDDDDDDDDKADEPPSSPFKLTINAAHSIHGSNNLVPTSPTPLADAAKFSTMLLAAINQIHTATSAAPPPATKWSSKRMLKVDVTINCGITVIGDRNVVGNVGLKPKSSSSSSSSSPAQTFTGHPDAGPGNGPVVAGAKRKAGEDVHDEREAKKLAIDPSREEAVA